MFKPVSNKVQFPQMEEGVLKYWAEGDVFRKSLDRNVGKERYTCTVRKVQAMASYATWRATKTLGQYDVKSFDVKVVPEGDIEGLCPGMTAILEPVKK